MLAYVFWHWHNAQIDDIAYQQALKGFHETLATHRPEGFHYSRVLAMAQFPWLDRIQETYEDWYIVENSTALDPLDRGAVSGACLEPHNRVARWTEGGTAGLYTLRFGEARASSVRFAYRFNKPAGMSYSVLYDLLRPLEERQVGSLWIRKMTLGPGPELCLHTPEQITLPATLQALEIPVQQLWVGAQ